jgi:hypothetical protein
VLNTPSHHRVHHGINPQYQDRNYAGVFIIWDRLFGSFEPEVEPPVYGITKPLASWNPIWANLHVFVDIARKAWQASAWRDKLRVIFGGPGFSPAELGESEHPVSVTPATYHKFDPPEARSFQAYAAVQFGVAMIGAVALLAAAKSLPVTQTLAGVFYLVLALSHVAALLESRPWAPISETIRLLVLAAAAAVLLAQGRGPSLVMVGSIVFALASTVWIVALGTRRSALGTRPGSP